MRITDTVPFRTQKTNTSCDSTRSAKRAPSSAAVVGFGSVVPIAGRAESSKAVDMTRRRVVVIGGRLGLTMTHRETSVQRPSPRVRFQGQRDAPLGGWIHKQYLEISRKFCGKGAYC